MLSPLERRQFRVLAPMLQLYWYEVVKRQRDQGC